MQLHMKIQMVSFNNRKRAFEVEAGQKYFLFPYAKLQPTLSAEERVAEASIDRELRREGFTYKKFGARSLGSKEKFGVIGSLGSNLGICYLCLFRVNKGHGQATTD